MRRRNPDYDHLRSVVAAWKARRVLILGDVILDEFVLGRTDRVSREAPVVVVRYDGSSWSPGGAANAAQNVAALGGAAVPVSVVGDDPSGDMLAGLLRAGGSRIAGLIRCAGTLTTTKTRVMAGDFHAQRQQVVRIDREQEGALCPKTEARVLDVFAREVKRADAVLFSDYHQNLFTARIIRESIGMCRAARVPSVVDSRFRLGEFRGVTVATPNEVEAARAAGVDLEEPRALERAGRYLLRRLAARSILVTRGKFGMTLFERGARSVSIGVVGSAEATDVTGAGDTVAAAVALTLGAGFEMATAMRVANIAASIVVMKRGTAVASPAEIFAALDLLERDGGKACG